MPNICTFVWLYSSKQETGRERAIANMHSNCSTIPSLTNHQILWALVVCTVLSVSTFKCPPVGAVLNHTVGQKSLTLGKYAAKSVAGINQLAMPIIW